VETGIVMLMGSTVFDTFKAVPSSVASVSETAGEMGVAPFMLGGCSKAPKRILTLFPVSLGSSCTSDGKRYENLSSLFSISPPSLELLLTLNIKPEELEEMSWSSSRDSSCPIKS
jgi:hypothetical protein